jgi:hypothetical protein
MPKARTIVDRSGGALEFLPLEEIWAVAGVLADTFPLDRSLARAPRLARRLSHWIRLVLVDRPLTNRDRTALLTLSDTPWVPAVAAALVAAVVAPRIPRRVRWLLFGAAVVWAVRGGRAARYLAMRRELAAVAPGAVLVGDFVALRPGVATGWVAEALRMVGDVTPYVALLPDSGDARRDAARERLYVRQLGLRVAGTTAAAGQRVTILVHD